ncbi:uncharacterized protein K452DRAFT_305038 [Aplosporella prunicola CBS 121167]|uniref:Apple domain-containing protein n=1 Tax=Aplosporella prunicola CBS 121167 TaxID=1176127 RepID=A0A6A6BPJ0_9PEZI|nr:uncharacterized protein K452DRAFT_305038 [Aplosporella prunicola CBS 121167]KAF2146049.1 hypothetical protein K452DRAFT_305038 [Aplosporella prunicola CBS 121167]
MSTAAEPALSDLPEVAPSRLPHEGLQPVHPDRATISPLNSNIDTGKIRAEGEEERPRRRKICGCAPKTFWIISTIVAVVVIGAAVGGGIGGALRHKKEEPSAAQSVSTSSGSSPSTNLITASSDSIIASVTITEVPGPTTTLLSDCPSSNNTVYNISYGSSKPMSFLKICGKSYLNSIYGTGVNSVNQQTQSLNDCIQLCAAFNTKNKTEIADGTSSPCNAVCWRNTFKNNDFPGQCFRYLTQKSSNEFIIRDERNCDSAAWINQ